MSPVEEIGDDDDDMMEVLEHAFDNEENEEESDEESDISERLENGDRLPDYTEIILERSKHPDATSALERLRSRPPLETVPEEETTDTPSHLREAQSLFAPASSLTTPSIRTVVKTLTDTLRGKSKRPAPDRPPLPRPLAPKRSTRVTIDSASAEEEITAQQEVSFRNITGSDCFLISMVRLFRNVPLLMDIVTRMVDTVPHLPSVRWMKEMRRLFTARGLSNVSSLRREIGVYFRRGDGEEDPNFLSMQQDTSEVLNVLAGLPEFHGYLMRYMVSTECITCTCAQRQECRGVSFTLHLSYKLYYRRRDMSPLHSSRCRSARTVK